MSLVVFEPRKVATLMYLKVLFHWTPWTLSVYNEGIVTLVFERRYSDVQLQMWSMTRPHTGLALRTPQSNPTDNDDTKAAHVD